MTFMFVFFAVILGIFIVTVWQYYQITIEFCKLGVILMICVFTKLQIEILSNNTVLLSWNTWGDGNLEFGIPNNVHRDYSKLIFLYV